MAAASSAHAEGFELGARLGYGIPFGKVTDDDTDDDNDLSDGISGMIPLQLDIGYRVIPQLMVGGYFMYGFGFTGDVISDACDRIESLGGEASCSTNAVRLGLQAQYHFTPDGDVDPWVGAGIGYEWLTFGVDSSSGGTSIDTSISGHGFEFISLQGGVDFSLAPGFGLGPFALLSIAQYSKTSISCSGSGCGEDDEESEDIDDKAMHQWLLLGVRGTFVL